MHCSLFVPCRQADSRRALRKFSAPKFCIHRRRSAGANFHAWWRISAGLRLPKTAVIRSANTDRSHAGWRSPRARGREDRGGGRGARLVRARPPKAAIVCGRHGRWVCGQSWKAQLIEQNVMSHRVGKPDCTGTVSCIGNGTSGSGPVGAPQDPLAEAVSLRSRE